MSIKIGVAFAIGVFLGSLVIWLSPLIFFTNEPWDTSGGMFFGYLIELFMCGFFGSLYYPQKFLITIVGIYIGQLVAQLLFVGMGPLWLIGFIEIAIYCIFALLGGFLAQLLMRKKGSNN